MFSFFFLLASSLCMLVRRQVMVRNHLPPICLTLELLRLLVLLVDVPSIRQGFQTLKAIYL
jgi:hypothetical protein